MPGPQQTQTWLIEQVAALLELDQTEVDPEADLISLGLNSIQTLELSAKLEDFVERPIDPRWVLTHNTISDLVCYLESSS